LDEIPDNAMFKLKTGPKVLLKKWLKYRYRGKKIRITEKPYYTHLTAVSKMAARCTLFGSEIGLCHDLLEDTTVTPGELMATLVNFGYQSNDAIYITSVVKELTDVFTPLAYPHLKKRERKAKENKRLLLISPDAQTVKYCDLIYNIDWMLINNRQKAKKYLKKKKWLINRLDKGNDQLHLTTMKAIKTGLNSLKHI
jgi:(p)ppGpp synthase/HD superfamily hydrolase